MRIIVTSLCLALVGCGDVLDDSVSYCTFNGDGKIKIYRDMQYIDMYVGGEKTLTEKIKNCSSDTKICYRSSTLSIETNRSDFDKRTSKRKNFFVDTVNNGNRYRLYFSADGSIESIQVDYEYENGKSISSLSYDLCMMEFEKLLLN